MKTLYKDIFEQFQGIYLDEKQLHISIFKEGAENQTVYLNKEDKVTVDFMNTSKIKELSLGKIIETDNFILTNYAKNPNRGVVIVITGKFNIMT